MSSPFSASFLSHVTSSLFQPMLTQPASLSASPGASARLSCTLSSGYSVGDFSLSWFQQKPGSPPWHLLRVNPRRISGSKHASANAGLLLVSGLQPEAEADSACAVGHGGTNAYTALQTREDVRGKPPLTPARGLEEV
ncbi:hypothetical protein FD754_024928 [Muntiacus muntjak]|uniref:Ig-like domain-containing protein n=1 Tax=Muntiacus muntjak TaxID=9888 RepID=A0A5N3UMJ2_MUNMU|nr:hypothetical protein FD754_024928 [Muntiacus muntjak]